MGWLTKDPNKPRTTIIHALDVETGTEQKIRFRGTEAELNQERATIKSCGMRIVQET